ncbi:autotransporter-associated beta strand repeat-containing protein [Termitidicoccus mucosus]
MNSQTFPRFLAFPALLLAHALLPLLAPAQSSTFTGANNANWSAPASWGNGVPDSPGAEAVFDNNVTTTNRTVNVDGRFIVDLLTFGGTSATARTFALNSGTLRLENTLGDPDSTATILFRGRNNVSISSVLDLGANLDIIAHRYDEAPGLYGSLLLSGDILGNGRAITVYASLDPALITLSGNITGAGTRFQKVGSGTLAINNTAGGDSTFSGGLEILDGSVIVGLSLGANRGAVLGGLSAGNNILGAGGVHVANPGSSLTINSGTTGNFVALEGALLDLDTGGGMFLNETAAADQFRLALNSGTLGGGSNAASRGVLTLSGVDFAYNENAAGGSAFTGAPTLIFDTSRNTGTMTVTLNNTAMLSGLGLVRKTGTNALTFTAGDTGTFRSTDFVIESGLGPVLFNQTALDLTGGGLIFTGADSPLVSWFSPTSVADFGRADQLSAATALTLTDAAIANILTHGFSQSFSSVTLGAGARLGVWLDAATPSTLHLDALAAGAPVPASPGSQGADYFSIFNWAGNPASHLATGLIASSGHAVTAGASVDLDRIWFRGYAPGAVLDTVTGRLAPSGFLVTTATRGGYYFDFANWSVDIPNGAGSTLIAVTDAYLDLQSQPVTIGHLRMDAGRQLSLRDWVYDAYYGDIPAGRVVFDSGVPGTGSFGKAPSVVAGSGTGYIAISTATTTLTNDLDVSAGLYIVGTLQGAGNIAVNSNGNLYFDGLSPLFTGNIDVHASGTLWLHNYHGYSFPDGEIRREHSITGTVSIHDGGWLAGDSGLSNSSYRTSVITSRVIIDGDIGMSDILVDYAGDIALTADRVISVGTRYPYLLDDSRAWTGFGANTRLIGAASLTLNMAGNTPFVFAGGSNSFSGGYTQRVASGGDIITHLLLHSDLVTGALAPGNNYIGTGSINLPFYSGYNGNNTLQIDAQGAHNVSLQGLINLEGSQVYIAPASYPIFQGRIDVRDAGPSVTMSGTMLGNRYGSFHVSSTNPALAFNMSGLMSGTSIYGDAGLDTVEISNASGTLTASVSGTVQNTSSITFSSLDTRVSISGSVNGVNLNATGVSLFDVTGALAIATNSYGALNINTGTHASSLVRFGGDQLISNLIVAGAGPGATNSVLIDGNLAIADSWGGNGRASFSNQTVTVSGSVQSYGADITFTNSPFTLTDSAIWAIGYDPLYPGQAYLTSDSDLTLNAPFTMGYMNITTNPARGATMRITSTMAGGIVNVYDLAHAGSGIALLDTPASVSSVQVRGGGNLILGGDNYIRPREPGVIPELMLTGGGVLQTTGGSAGSPYSNTFSYLVVPGAGGVFMEDHSALWFTGSYIGTSTASLLNLANSTGRWSTSALPAYADTYLYFSNTGGFTPIVLSERISFTGYAAGAELVQVSVSGTNWWFLAPTGEPVIEWGGARSTGTDTDRLWRSGSNWIGNPQPVDGSVTGAGISIAVRDIDGLLDGNLIVVNQDAVIGKMYLESSGGQTFAITGTDGHFLTFDSGTAGVASRLVNRSVHSATIAADLRLDSDLELVNNTAGATANSLVLAGRVTGAGALVFSTTLGSLTLGSVEAGGTSTSDFTGGFRLTGTASTFASATHAASPRLYLTGSGGSIFGSGSLAGAGTDASLNLQSLLLGDGTADRWLRIDTTSTAVSFDSTLRLAGNLVVPVGTLWLSSDAPSLITAGTWALAGNIWLDTPLQGAGGALLLQGGDYRFGRAGTFDGGVTAPGSGISIHLGHDAALGTGTVTLGGTTAFYTGWTPAATDDRVIANPFAFNPGAAATFSGGTLTLGYSGTTFLPGLLTLHAGAAQAVVIPERNILAGSGSLTLTNSLTGSGTATGDSNFYLLGASERTGNTTLTGNGGRHNYVRVDNEQAFGSGTVIFSSNGSGGGYPTLYPLGSTPFTLTNPVAFGNWAELDASSVGLLTLDSAGTDVYRPILAIIGGTVAFGPDFTITGGSLDKRGAGMLVLNDGRSTFSGGFSMRQGWTRVNAAADPRNPTGGITIGAAAAGENYLGTGGLSIRPDYGIDATLELITTSTGQVNFLFGANVSVDGRGRINITDTAGMVSGTGIRTLYNPSTASISTHFYNFYTAGDFVMEKGLLYIGGSIGGDFTMHSGSYYSAATYGGNITAFNSSTIYLGVARLHGDLAMNDGSVQIYGGNIGGDMSMRDGRAILGGVTISGGNGFTMRDGTVDISGFTNISGTGGISMRSGTASLTSSGSTAGGYTQQSGVLNWTNGNPIVPSVTLGSGTLNLGTARTMTRVGNLNLGDVTTNLDNAGNYIFSAGTLNLLGTGTLAFVSATTGNSILQFNNIGQMTGSLDVLNWRGDYRLGGGATRIQFTQNIGQTALDYAQLGRISFYTNLNNGVEYAPGARIVYNSGNYYELVPVGLSATWKGGTVGNLWSNAGNWSGNLVPQGDGSFAIFASPLNLQGGGPLVVNVDAVGLVLGGLVFRNDEGISYRLGGNPITLAVPDPDGAATLRLQNNNSVNIDISDLYLRNTVLADMDGSGTLTISTKISEESPGAGKGLIKSGSGWLELGSANNTFSGGVTLLEGVLAASVSNVGAASGPFGTGAVTVAGTLAPTLAFTGPGVQQIDNAVILDTAMSGTPAALALKLLVVAGNESTLGVPVTETGGAAGSVEKTGAGRLALTGVQQYTGTTTVTAGTLALTANNALAAGAAVTVNATLVATGTQALRNLGGTAAGAVIRDASRLVLDSSGVTSFAGAITGAADVEKTGASTLALAGANQYTGTTLVTAGTLALTGTNAIATSAAVTVNASLLSAVDQTIQNLAGTGTLTQTAATLTADNTADTTFAGLLTGAGNFAKTGPATLTLTGSQAHTGTTTVTAGTLALLANNALASSAAITVNATLAATGTQTLNNLGGAAAGAVILDASRLILASSEATSFAGAITGTAAVEKTGPAALTFSGSQRYTGATTVTGGTLSLLAANAIASSTSVVVDGVLTAAASQTLRNLASTAATGTVLLGPSSGHIVLLSEQATTYAGAIAAATGTLQKTGDATLTLTGTTNSAAGLIEAGAVALPGGSGVPAAFWGMTGNLTVAGTGAAALAITGSSIVTNTIGYIGNAVGSSGTVSVGDTALWQNAGNLNVGNSGAGFLSIANGGAVTSLAGNIGRLANSSGTVSVSGSALWNNTGALYVGDSGAGFLTLAGSGTVTNANGYIGYNYNSSGSVSVSGSAVWQNNGGLNVGEYGAGFLSIDGGGFVSSYYGNIGRSGSNASGIVSVSGSAFWQNNNALSVGIYAGATAVLSIAGSGSVFSYDGYIGYLAGSSGSVSLSGSARWQNPGNLYAGYDASGTAALSLSDDARVIVGGRYAQNALSTLALDVSNRTVTDAFITAGSGTLGGALAVANFTGTFSDAVLSGTKFSDMNLTGVTGTLIHATGGTLAGDFASVTGAGSSPVDYLFQGARKSADGFDYVLAADLSWRAGGTHAHGTFTIVGGTSFELDASLGDTAANLAKNNWAGDTLTKAGAGLLILSASNAHTGATLVTAGTLRATHLGALGQSLASIESLASLELSGLTGTLTNTLAGSGTLRVVNNSAIDYRGAATTWDGVTLVDGGFLRVNSAFGNPAAASLLVTAGGTLGGTGTVGGDVTLAGGGHLAPGNSPGMLTIAGTLSLNNAVLTFDLGAITSSTAFSHLYPTGTNDLLHVTGDVLLSGTSTLHLITTASLAKGEYDLVNYDGVLVGGAANLALGTLDSGSMPGDFYISTAENHWIKLVNGPGGFTYWDGGDNTRWNNGGIDGGSGTWFAAGASPAYSAWTGSTGAANAGWSDAGFAIFRGVSGTVTVDSTTGTVAFSGAQFLTDGYLITGGTLTTGGTDASILLNITGAISATIATPVTGTHGLEKAGAGALRLAGANTYTGTTTVQEGALVITHTAALGTGAAVINTGATLQVATGGIVFSNTLGGAGLLHVALATPASTFAFDSTAMGSSFSGTALFNASAFNLDNNALAAAAVVLGTANTTNVASGTHRLGSGNPGGLVIDGANVVFSYAAGAQAGGIILTDTLDGASGTITITNTNAASGTTGLFADKTLLQQDEATGVRLIRAFTNTGTNLTLAGGGTTTAAIRDGSAVTTATAAYAQALDYTDGLSVNYTLTQLDLLAGQTTTLASDTTVPAGGDELHALISGSGNLAINATGAITLNNAANSYTGTTLVNTGTLISGTNNALGVTSHLAVATAAAYDLAGRTQSIGSGSIDGALRGSGSLGLDGRVDITSTNAAFTANAGVTGTTTLHNTQALGNSGTAEVTGILRLDGATGALAKQIAGTGTVALVNTSSVALAAANGNFSGEWNIAAGNALSASSTANLSDADILLDGLLTVANTSAETLGNALTGSGTFNKDAAGNLTISQSNAYTGSAGIRAGTLTLANLGGLGAATIANSSTFDLAGTGAFHNAVSGTGVTVASGGVSLRGANTGFTGTLAVTGTADIIDNDALGGATAKVVIAASGELATTATNFVHTLTGGGVLAVNASANGGVFDFEIASGTAFAGTVKLDATTLHLGTSAAHDHNALALANAKLRVLAGSTLATNAETRRLGALDLDAGVTLIDMTAVLPAQVLQTGTLSVDGAARVAFRGYTGSGTVNSGTNPVNFLDQDSLTANATLLIGTDYLATPNVQVGIYAEDGVTAISGSGRQIDYGNVLATYAYTGVTGTAIAYTGIASSTVGLFYDYALTELYIKSGSTLTLDNTASADNTLAALVTGPGSLELIAGAGGGGAITLSHSNSYTGTTIARSGTTILGATDALGQTSHLIVTNSAALDLNGNTQSIGSGSIAGALRGSGSLGLGGTVDITSTNAAFTANAGVTGTAILHHTQALGDAGTLDVTGLVTLDDATGALAKTVAGTGTVSLVSTSSVALTAANTLSGEWNIAAGNALSASSTANLSDADILLDGLLTVANTADETLGNALTGSGTFIKDAAGNLTISQSNAFTGSAGILAGTLALANNLDGLGTATIANSSTLALSGTGAFANTISGTGVNLVSGSVALAGTNTAFTGTLAVTGTATITTNDNIGGATASVNIASAGKLATTATTFVHALTGNGVLAANTGATFELDGNVGAAFTGTVTLDSTTLHLGAAQNDAVLANATLQLNPAGELYTHSGTNKLAGLTLNGGALWIPMNGVDPVEVLNTGALSITDLSSTVVFENYTSGTVAPADVNKNFLDQDILGENATLLVAADTLIENAPVQIDIKKTDGTALSNGQIIDYGNVLARYDYAAMTASATTSGAPAAGLYYDYVLRELNVKTGTTLALDTTGATDNTLAAAITGDGSVTYATGSTLVLASAGNTYTGTSTILTGTVVAGADHALGYTARLDIAAAGAFDLGAHTQTIANGGTIAGHLAGAAPGALTLDAGTLTITSANTAYTADTLINPAATARITGVDALGASAITLDGTLTVDVAAPASGELKNTLAGTGLFQKINTGTVTLGQSSAGFTGTGTVASGRVIATRIDALGTAAIGVAAGAALEHLNVTGTLQNALAGAGTHLVTGGTLLLRDPAAIAYDIENTTLNANAALVLGSTGHNFGTLNMNGGALAFATPTGTATIKNLGNSTGHIYMNADLTAAGTGVNAIGVFANYLAITGSSAGAHTVHVETNGTEPSIVNLAVPLIGTGTAGSLTVFNLDGGRIETALTTLELLPGDGSAYIPNPNTWYLTDAGLSHTADAILSTASSLALDWAAALDSLHLRLGDIRAELLSSTSTSNLNSVSGASGSGNVWVRSRGYRLNAANALSGMAFEQYGWGVTGGLDKAFETPAGANLLGGFIDMAGVDRKFDNSGNGKTHSAGIGAYATLLRTDGWFLDAIARLDRYSNEFEARAANGRLTRGKYNTKGASLSVELGRRLGRTDGWWLEPSAQVATLWLSGVNYATQPNAIQRAIPVRVDDSRTYQYRAQLRFGKQLRDSKWHPYGKFAAVAVDSSGGEIKAHGKSFQADYDGKRVEFGVGTSYRINNLSQAYLDYEYAKAANYERPWSLNLGYRRLW